MRRLINTACAILFCIIIISCAITITKSPELVYFNSFESSEDTTDWHGVTEEMFVDDPAPGCGEQSLYIGGGCIHVCRLHQNRKDPITKINSTPSRKKKYISGNLLKELDKREPNMIEYSQ